MKKNTEILFTKDFSWVKDIDATKIGTETEEVIAIYQNGKVKIPIIVAYRNGGVNPSGVKIAYKSTVIDTGKIYAVVCTPEHFSKEALAEVLLTKVYTLRNVLNGEDTVRAEAMARAEVANAGKLRIGKVNRSNQRNTIRQEMAISKTAKTQYKNLKQAEKSAAANKATMVEMVTIVEDALNQVTNKLDKSETLPA